MIVTSADVVPGQNVQVLGLVRGNIVTSRHIGRDMMAGMKELVGGEIKSYTEMTDQARTVAEGRMIAEAERLGADAVVAMRFSSGSINPGTIEMLAYGTAVKFVEPPSTTPYRGPFATPRQPRFIPTARPTGGQRGIWKERPMPTPEFITNLRAKIDNDPLWLTGITAYVEDAQGRILLGKRADTGQWALVYGIVEPAEEPADTCVREALEETGVDIEPVSLVSVKSSPYMVTYANGDQCQYMDLLFF